MMYYIMSNVRYLGLLSYHDRIFNDEPHVRRIEGGRGIEPHTSANLTITVSHTMQKHN